MTIVDRRRIKGIETVKIVDDDDSNVGSHSAFSCFSVITNFMLIAECEFFILGGDVKEGSIGLFFVDPPTMDGGCMKINQDDFKSLNIDDAAWKCARVCACMAASFGVLMSVLVVFKQCIIPLPCHQRLVDLSSVVIQVGLALVYLMWRSDACDVYVCNYGKGGTLLICTQVLWLAAGCFSRCMRDGRYERREEIAASKETQGRRGRSCGKRGRFGSPGRRER